MLSVNESHGSLKGVLEYRADAFSKEFMTQFAARLNHLFDAVTCFPGRSILDLPIFESQQESRVIQQHLNALTDVDAEFDFYSDA